MWQDLWAALALMLILEGMFPFLNPTGLRRMLQMMADLSDSQLRYAGMTSMLVGVMLLYFVRH
jgi:uncharacterized protein YjeT (DUF2065 family)